MARITIPRNQQSLLEWARAIKRNSAALAAANAISQDVLEALDTLIAECEFLSEHRNDLRNQAQAATEDTQLAFGTHKGQSVNTEGSLVYYIHKAILQIKADKPGKAMEFRKYGIEAKHTKVKSDLEVEIEPYDEDVDDSADPGIGIDEEGVGK